VVGRAVEVEVEVEVERIMNGPFAAVRGQKKGEGGQRVKGYGTIRCGCWWNERERV
jgi:hypothetical protein